MGEPAGKIIDKYSIVRLLGEGGMGEVYEAEHTMVGQKCALKLLRSGLAADDNIVKRMMNEARAAAKIGHPNIVQTYDFGTLDNGGCYLAMELLDGEGLDALIERHQTLEIQTSIAILLQVLSALVAAHTKGIVHRDLKPENIFIAKAAVGGTLVKLLDFGISKFKYADEDTLRLTHTGAVMGTPYYMSPEQAGGAKDVDQRSDLWSLGVILYQMLTGKMPFTGDNYNQLILKICTKPFVAPRQHCPDIPEALEAIVIKALHKELPARFQRATQMIEALLPLYDRTGAQAGRFVLSDDILRNPQRRSGQRQVVKEAFSHTAPAGIGDSDPAIEKTLLPDGSDPIGVQTGPEHANPFGDDQDSRDVALTSSDPNAEPPLRESGGNLSATATRYSGSSPKISLADITDDPSANQTQPPPSTQARHVKLSTVLVVALGLIAVGALAALGFVLLREKSPSSARKAGSSAVSDTMGAQMDSGVGTATQQLNPPPRPRPKRAAPVLPIVIKLEGLPRRAKVWVDGRRVKHPIHMKSDGRSHRLKVSARGHKDHETSFIATSDLTSIPLDMGKRRTGRRKGKRPPKSTKPPMKRIGWGDPFARSAPRPAMRTAPRPTARPMPPPMRRRPRRSDGVYGNPYSN